MTEVIVVLDSRLGAVKYIFFQKVKLRDAAGKKRYIIYIISHTSRLFCRQLSTFKMSAAEMSFFSSQLGT